MDSVGKVATGRVSLWLILRLGMDLTLDEAEDEVEIRERSREETGSMRERVVRSRPASEQV